jgi:hypothetical protein
VKWPPKTVWAVVADDPAIGSVWTIKTTQTLARESLLNAPGAGRRWSIHKYVLTPKRKAKKRPGTGGGSK